MSDQLSQGDGFVAAGKRLQSADVILLEPQFSRLLDAHDPLVARDAAGETVEQRRLPAAGAARDEYVRAGPDTRLKKRGGFHRQGAEADQVTDLVWRRGKPADGHHRSIDRDRRQHHRHTGAIG